MEQDITVKNSTVSKASLPKKSSKNLTKEKMTQREKLSIYGTSITWTTGRSTIFTWLGIYGVILGASPFEQSILTSVRNLGSNVFQSIWGWLADLRGRKLVMIIGFVTLTISTFFAPFVNSPFQLILLALIMTSIGFAIIPAWTAFLGDYASNKFRATFIGNINSIGTVFAVIALLFMGILMDIVAPYPKDATEYMVSQIAFVVPFFIAMVMLLFWSLEIYM